MEVTKDVKKLSNYTLIDNEYIVGTFKYNNELYYIKQNGHSDGSTSADETVSIYKNGSTDALHTTSYAVDTSGVSGGPSYILTDEYIYFIEYDNKHMHAVKLSDFSDTTVSEQSFNILSISNRVKDTIYFLNTAGTSFVDINGNTTSVTPTLTDAQVVIVSSTDDYIAINSSNNVELHFNGVSETLSNTMGIVFNGDDFDTISSDKEATVGSAVYSSLMQQNLTPVKTPVYVLSENNIYYISKRTVNTTPTTNLMIPAFTDDIIGIYSFNDTFMYVLDDSSAMIAIANTKNSGFMLFNDGLPNGFVSFEVIADKEALITANENGVAIKEDVPLDIRTTDITFNNKIYCDGVYYDAIINNSDELYKYFDTKHCNETVLIKNAGCYKNDNNDNCYCYSLNSAAITCPQCCVTFVFDNNNNISYIEVVNNLSDLCYSTLKGGESFAKHLCIIQSPVAIKNSTLTIENANISFDKYGYSYDTTCIANLMQIGTLNNSTIDVSCVCSNCACCDNVLNIENLNYVCINISKCDIANVTLCSENINNSCLCYLRLNACNMDNSFYKTTFWSNSACEVCGSGFYINNLTNNCICLKYKELYPYYANNNCLVICNLLYPTGFGNYREDSSIFEVKTRVCVLDNTATCKNYTTSSLHQVKYAIVNGCYTS